MPITDIILGRGSKMLYQFLRNKKVFPDSFFLCFEHKISEVKHEIFSDFLKRFDFMLAFCSNGMFRKYVKTSST